MNPSFGVVRQGGVCVYLHKMHADMMTYLRGSARFRLGLFKVVALLVVYPPPSVAFPSRHPSRWLVGAPKARSSAAAGQPRRAPSAAHNFVNVLDYANGRVARSPVAAS